MITIDPNAAVPWKGWAFCRCCGVRTMEKPIPADDHRCLKHRGRNPCAIEGCTKTTSANTLRLDLWLCGTHWRALVPLGSPERRIYLRFFRRWRRYGQTDESIRSFWRFWFRMIAKARAKAGGAIDVREINKVMGWD